MVFRSLDSNNDWNFGRGLNDYVKETNEVILDIKTRLREWVNDCFFSQNSGIDWATRLGSPNQRELTEQDIKTIILQTSGVFQIDNIDVTFEDRELKAFYRVTTIYSSTFEDILTQVV